MTGDADEEGFLEGRQIRQLMVKLGIWATGTGRQQGGVGLLRNRCQASRSSGPASPHQGNGFASGWRPWQESASGPGFPSRRGGGRVWTATGFGSV